MCGQFEPTSDDDRYGSCLFYVFRQPRRGCCEDYPLYLILGNTAFQLMNDATTSGMRSIIDASSLPGFASIVLFFPVQRCFCSCKLSFSLIAVGIVMLVFRIPLTIYSLLTPVSCCFACFCIGLAMLLSTALGSSLERYPRGRCNHRLVYGTPLFLLVNIMSPWMLQIERFNPMFAAFIY